MTGAERFTITAALPYANGPLHIGHLAGAYLSADAYARYLRLMGKEVVFVCGSDEYGAAISIKAKKEHTTPQAIVDKYHKMIKDSFDQIGISFDIYHRTTASIHAETAQHFFQTLYDNGEFEEKVSEQYYDEKAQMFLADRYIKGRCPNCNEDDAYGDQCEKCGASISPTTLINPVSTITNTKPILKETKHWYLCLDKHQDWIKEWITNGNVDGERTHYPEDWKKHVIGQCLSWIDNGLEPRSMTRDLDWGIDVPSSVADSEGKKLYVWLDAPIGYISATKEWAKQNDKDWTDYWNKGKSNVVHFIGKDNIVFHCIIFPAILKAYSGLELPVNVPANQFMNLEGRKLSTSKGWAVWVHEYLEEFEGKEDVLRYVLSKNMPEQKDSEFTWAGFQETNNSDLVNNLGNFVNRVMVLTNKYYDGQVPDFDPDESFETSADDLPSWHDSELLNLFDLMGNYVQFMGKMEFRSALKVVMQIASRGNLILQANEPWKAIKEDPELVKVVMNIGLQYVGALAYVCRPFMPKTSDKLRQMVNLPPFSEEGELVSALDDLAEGIPILDVSHKIGYPEHLFQRIDDDTIQNQVEKLKLKDDPGNAKSPKESIANISFEQFSQLDIKTGKILEALKVKKADKLLQLEVQLGSETRTIVSGIANFYKPEEIVGQQVVVLTNLEPRKIRGIHSEGMILMAEDDSGKLAFVSPPENWPSGSAVR